MRDLTRAADSGIRAERWQRNTHVPGHLNGGPRTLQQIALSQLMDNFSVNEAVETSPTPIERFRHKC
jgi:hypothetical protein